MKRLVLLLVAFMPLITNAQVLIEDFDSNNLKWNEYVDNRSSAVIKEGALCLEGKSNNSAMVSCYLPLDVTSPFKIKAKFIDTRFAFSALVPGALVALGFALNYLDDDNYCAFMLGKEFVEFQRWSEGKMVGHRRGQIKTSYKDTDYEIDISYKENRLILEINGVHVLEAYCVLEYNGFAVAVSGSAKVDQLEFYQPPID